MWEVRSVKVFLTSHFSLLTSHSAPSKLHREKSSGVGPSIGTGVPLRSYGHPWIPLRSYGHPWERCCRFHRFASETAAARHLPSVLDVRSSPRLISTGRLNALPRLHPRPINLVICKVSYQVNPVGDLILGPVSRLDAFSVYPVRTWLSSRATGATTGTPAVRPPRSSRTRGSPPQHPIRPWRIETELSHDVLNPARVPL